MRVRSEAREISGTNGKAKQLDAMSRTGQDEKTEVQGCLGNHVRASFAIVLAKNHFSEVNQAHEMIVLTSCQSVLCQWQYFIATIVMRPTTWKTDDPRSAIRTYLSP